MLNRPQTSHLGTGCRQVTNIGDVFGCDFYRKYLPPYRAFVKGCHFTDLTVRKLLSYRRVVSWRPYSHLYSVFEFRLNSHYRTEKQIVVSCKLANIANSVCDATFSSKRHPDKSTKIKRLRLFVYCVNCRRLHTRGLFFYANYVKDFIFRSSPTF